MVKKLLSHVPEGYFEYLKDEQRKSFEIQELRGKLLGNKVFGKSRGSWGQELEDLIFEIIDDAESVSDLERKLDDFCKNIKIMTTLQYRLLLKGHRHARFELRHALSEPHYLLPDEEFYLEDVEPVTMFMYEPDVTIPFLKFLTVVDCQILIKMLSGGSVKKLKNDVTNFDHDLAVSEILFEKLSSLKGLMKHREKEYYREGRKSGHRMFPWPNKVVAAYALDVLGKYEIVPKAYGKKPTDYNQLFPSFSMDIVDLVESYNPGQKDVLKHWKLTCDFIFLVKGTQDEVLAQYNRKQQKHIGTWQFKVPKCIGWISNNIGLHPEVEHADFYKARRSLVSLGVNAGMGGIVMPYSDRGLYPKRGYFDPVDPFRIMFGY